MRILKLVLVSALLLNFLPANVFATDVYVDNLLGNDLFDGLTETNRGFTSGPVKTLRRAMQIAGFGNRIVLMRSGETYYDSFSLTGGKHSGTSERPFTIVGNGATLSGARAVPREGWQRVNSDVWKLTLTRKGFFRLMNEGESVPELLPVDGKNPLTALQPHQWTAWRGDLYYRNEGDAPSSRNFSYAAEQTGLSLYHVEHVRIENVTLRDFRFDGVNIQNLCRGITLDNVTCTNNGRSGIAVGGSSYVDINGGSVSANGRESIRISGLATVVVNGTTTDKEPQLVP